MKRFEKSAEKIMPSHTGIQIGRGIVGSMIPGISWSGRSRPIFGKYLTQSQREGAGMPPGNGVGGKAGEGPGDVWGIWDWRGMLFV